MLFCIASATNWRKAGLSHMVARRLLVRGLIERQAAEAYVLSAHGRAVLEA
jgi:hypothetical protein